MPDSEQLLVLNAGSSSVKVARYEVGESPKQLWSGTFDRLKAKNDGEFTDWLKASTSLEGLAAVGHRIVHSGVAFTGPEWVHGDDMKKLEELEAWDPDHAPFAVNLIKEIDKRLKGLPQALCFDTTFHAHMPRVAKQLTTPREYEKLGLHRYGFHGLSYTYITEELARITRSKWGRVVICHLGSGASVAAVKDGVGVDTTMGFTPTSGIMMSTRTGDLDPGVLTFLARTKGLSPAQLDEMANKKSGLLGVSETSPDMRDLLKARSSDRRAAEAVALFCYQIKKAIGAFAAVLGGLDTLVFTGGIGEHAPEVRAMSAEGLEFLGIDMDRVKNEANAEVISANCSPVTVRVIQTNEEVVIAREVSKLIALRGNR